MSASWEGKTREADADALPGHYYVTVRRTTGQTAYAAGPFTQTRPGKASHLRALGLVRAVRDYVLEHDTTNGPWLTFGTARVPITSSRPPVGKLNEALGVRS